jgi:hypothetical protein
MNVAAYRTLMSLFYSCGYCSANFGRHSLLNRMKAFGGRRTFPPFFGYFTDMPEAGCIKALSGFVASPSGKKNTIVCQ